MTIKNKLSYSIAALLLLIVFLGLFSAGNIEKMRRDTENILADNYNSVKYAQQMQETLYSFFEDSTALTSFEKNLRLQAKNVTEPYEKEATETLIRQFESYKKNPSQQNYVALSKSINNVILLNTTAIYQKADVANKTSDHALIWIIVVALLSVLVAMMMLMRFPKTFTTPIKELTDGILEVANQNYNNRLNFKPGSEFGKVALSFNKMASQLAMYQKSSMAKIVSTKRNLEVIINSIDEPIIGLDNEKRILFVNSAACTILNLAHDQIIGRSALDVSLNNDLFRRLIRGLENADKKEEPLKIYADNKESFFQVHYTTPAEHTGTIIQLSNVTEFKELDSAKTNFISTISHELKTPISAILMSVKLLEDQRVGEMNPEQKALSQSIRESSDRLLNITSELLKMTQVETGKLQLDPKVTKPIELLNYAVNATRMLADKFGCNVEVEYPEKMAKLFVDSEKIAWVVTNLLSNAIHYSSENARIIVGARQDDKTIQIYVQDFGKGIDPRYHKSIFDRYFRVPGTKIQGSGLGLAISKEFVEAHGGTLHVESAIGQGSCFVVSLQIP